MTHTQKVEISHRTIIFFVFFLLLLWIIYQIRGIILLIFISIILMSALNPAVDFLQRFKIPRVISIAFFYALIIGFITSVVASFIPQLIDQTSHLIAATPSLINQVQFLAIDTTVIIKQLGSLPSNVFYLALGAVENIIVVFTVLVITFYLLLERKNLKKHLTMAFGNNGEKNAEEFVDKVERQLGYWIRGQLLSMTLVGLLTYTGLKLLGIEFALPLAILAAILEIIPNIGPVVASVPAIIIALAIRPTLALGVAALYFIIQQTEAQIITPNIMRHTIGFNPLITIIALISGFALGGIGGAVLSIPTLLIAQIIIQTIYKSREPRNKKTTYL